MLPDIHIFDTQFLYDILQWCLRIEAKSYDQIDYKLIGSNIYWKKKHGRQIGKDDCTFSVVYSLLKIKRKVYIFENIFKIPWNM